MEETQPSLRQIAYDFFKEKKPVIYSESRKRDTDCVQKLKLAAEEAWADAVIFMEAEIELVETK